MTDSVVSQLITVTGRDRPGITSALLTQLPPGLAVLDIEQVVVRGRLILAVLVTGPMRQDLLRALLDQFAADQDVNVSIEDAGEDVPRMRVGRANIVVMAPSIPSDALSAVTSDIAFSGANIDRVRRLADEPVTAVEFEVSGADVDALRRQLALDATAYGVDIAVAPGGLARRGHRLLVMDVDSTFIQDEVIDLLAARAGAAEQVAAITDRAMRGEIDFEDSLRERVATLAGLPAAALDEVRAELRLTPGARTLVRTVQRLGFRVALVSGGFEEIVRPLADELGITLVHANRLASSDGVLTGQLEGSVVDRAGKADALRRFADEIGVPLSRTVAIGDGANDLDMLATAGLGIAFNAKPTVQAQAHTSVNVPYLDSVLYVLGLTRGDIVDADELVQVAAAGEDPHGQRTTTL